MFFEWSLKSHPRTICCSHVGSQGVSRYCSRRKAIFLPNRKEVVFCTLCFMSSPSIWPLKNRVFPAFIPILKPSPSNPSSNPKSLKNWRIIWFTVVSYQIERISIKWELPSLLRIFHNSRENKKGSCHFDENLSSFWQVTTVQWCLS